MLGVTKLGDQVATLQVEAQDNAPESYRRSQAVLPFSLSSGGTCGLESGQVSI